jgi:hypothetical protein
MTDDELRDQANAAAPFDLLVSAADVLRVLDDLAGQKRMNLALAERVRAQSELLSKRAEPSRN